MMSVGLEVASSTYFIAQAASIAILLRLSVLNAVGVGMDHLKSQLLRHRSCAIQIHQRTGAIRSLLMGRSNSLRIAITSSLEKLLISRTGSKRHA